MNETYVTHNQLLIILLIILLGVTIFSYAMINHAVELRNRTTQIIEDLTDVQTYIDVELAAKLIEQQASITLISDVQQFQGTNIEKLNENSNITYNNTQKIIDNANYSDARNNTTLNGYNYPLG
jgi:hypothetical protein